MVIDASVVTNAVAVPGPAGETARRVLRQESRLHAPFSLNAEVMSALRGMVRRGALLEHQAKVAATGAVGTRIRRYPFEPFALRAWELRDNLTTYDAWYVALAETLEAPLVTADARLRRAEGPRCPVLSPEEALTT